MQESVGRRPRGHFTGCVERSAGDGLVEYSGYDISVYRETLKVQALDVLKYLLGEDDAANRSYFEWKYEDNPSTDSPLVIVCLKHGKVVGLRGYLANKWLVNDAEDPIIILSPGDTCVHPDHRRKGLSVAMGKLAMAEYAQDCRAFVNLSCTRDSLPGYLRMGFQPLVNKVYLTRCNLLGLTRFIASAGKTLSLDEHRVQFGQCGDVVVSDRPKARDMASVIGRGDSGSGKIRLLQDEEFFRWRFGNRRNKYLFYYLLKEDVAAGYVVVRVSPNNRRGYIVDFAGADDRCVEELMRYIVKAQHFNVLSIYQHSVADGLSRMASALRFTANGLMRILERRVHGELPLLVRPVKREPTDDDWCIGGRDLRNFDNWSIKGICSDET